MKRSTYEISDEAVEVLNNFKRQGKLKKDKAIEYSILFADKYKDEFAAFIREKIVFSFQLEEKKSD